MTITEAIRSYDKRKKRQPPAYKLKKNRGKSKGKSKGAKGKKHSGKGRGLSGFGLSKSEANSESQESELTYSTHRQFVVTIGVTLDGVTDGVQLDGMKAGASSLSLGSFDLDAVSSSKQFEWVRKNLDTWVAVETHLY